MVNNNFQISLYIQYLSTKNHEKQKIKTKLQTYSCLCSVFAIILKDLWLSSQVICIKSVVYDIYDNLTAIQSVHTIACGWKFIVLNDSIEVVILSLRISSVWHTKLNMYVKFKITLHKKHWH